MVPPYIVPGTCACSGRCKIACSIQRQAKRLVYINKDAAVAKPEAPRAADTDTSAADTSAADTSTADTSTADTV